MRYSASKCLNKNKKLREHVRDRKCTKVCVRITQNICKHAAFELVVVSCRIVSL
jgi:hypothetical protein